MRVWSPLVTAAVILAGVNAQLSVEIVEDDITEPFIGFSEAMNGPGPCNGYPEYKEMPINQGFYLGIHNAEINEISQALSDGIRYLDINLCKTQGSIVACSSDDGTPLEKTFESMLQEIFLFSRGYVQQFFIINIRSENVAEPVGTKELEAAIDDICKIHTEATAGTDEFVERECPFIYTRGKGPWPSIANIVEYFPEMAQWEGDGEVVGVRSKFMITKSDQITITPGYNAAYFTPAFWRSIHKVPVSSVDDLKANIRKECRIPAGGVALEAYFSNHDEFNYTPEIVEDILLSRKGCNLNDSPLNTFISLFSANVYKDQMPYLKELEKRMMDLNYAKWSGNYDLIKPSKFIKNEEKKVERDEL
ncbi:hypothetical protein [Parasitella parasitica]|uniref:Phosphatidylinositol-specific phospholipase C X domain-containing protein n=1 Tax=Parasitella parasitica TaxID=35722 RepID=A0A0B7NLD2_9FUNG|nr:hypothetical protein [Parasitella parasitica]